MTERKDWYQLLDRPLHLPDGDEAKRRVDTAARLKAEEEARRKAKLPDFLAQFGEQMRAARDRER